MPIGRKKRRYEIEACLFLHWVRKEKGEKCMQCSQCGYYIKSTDRYYHVIGNHPVLKFDAVVIALVEKYETHICSNCFGILSRDYSKIEFKGVRDFFVVSWLVFEEYQNRRKDAKKSQVYEYELDRETFDRLICSDSPF